MHLMRYPYNCSLSLSEDGAIADREGGRDGWKIELMEATSRRRCLFLSLKGFQQQCQGSLVQMLEASVGEEEASALTYFFHLGAIPLCCL